MATKPTIPKQRSLASLEEVYFSEGYRSASDAFRRMLPDIDLRSHYLQRPGQGQSVQRTDSQASDGITYQSYNAPALWDVPYSLLRVGFEYVPKTDFMYHGGEELLIPISGRIFYHFFCNSDGKPPERKMLDAPLEPGHMIRINPQLPHHTWAADRSGAEAWMIIRHLSDTATSISVNYELAEVDVHSAPRRTRAKDLREPGRYSLVAWGLAEKLRYYRERANLRIAQLAAACGIDPSHLSRIENADTNVSIETLIRIARALHLSIDSLIAPMPWNCRIYPLTQAGETSSHVFFEEPPGPDHFLHPSYHYLPAGCIMDDLIWPESEAVASWIMLAGRIIVEIRSGSGNSPELLEKGSVIHFRHASPTRIQALEESRILQVIYSGSCSCLSISQKS